MLKIGLGLLVCFLFIGCKSYDGSIETLYYFEYPGQNGYDTIVPKRYKPYISRELITKFGQKGFNREEKNPGGVFHKILYVWIIDSLFNGRRLKDTVVKSNEAYIWADGVVGKSIGYYPNGKISFQNNCILMNDSTKKTISVEQYNKLRVDDKQKYTTLPDDTLKYYSTDGKLTKEEMYDKGTLLKTINY